MEKIIKEVGIIGVDAGICWIGDPCYIHPDGNVKNLPKEFGKTWDEFCDKLWSKEEHNDKEVLQTAVQFNYDNGGPGLGVCVGTGWGDGVYPVFAEFEKDSGRIKKIWIEFISDEEESLEE